MVRMKGSATDRLYSGATLMEAHVRKTTLKLLIAAPASVSMASERATQELTCGDEEHGDVADRFVAAAGDHRITENRRERDQREHAGSGLEAICNAADDEYHQSREEIHRDREVVGLESGVAGNTTCGSASRQPQAHVA